VKLPSIRGRLSPEAFAERLVQKLTGLAPDLEMRLVEGMTLRIVGPRSEQRVHLDRAFEQYQKKPENIEEILGRWCASLVAIGADVATVSLEAVVPIVKGRRWIDLQRAHHIEQFGDDSAFGLCWERYNTELIVVYAEFKEGLRYLRAADVGENALDWSTLRAQSIANLRRRTQELRFLGGGDKAIVISGEGNLEPSLILLEELWDDPRLRVAGNRLVTIAARGFALTCGADNPWHIWQLAADAAESYRKAQYPVSPHLFEQRANRFEVVDFGEADANHPIPSTDNLDFHAIKKGGGSDLGLIIVSPLQADARSVYRLFQKLDNYLQFIAGDAYRQECGTPSPQSTSIKVSVHPKTDPAVLALLGGLGDWVKARNAGLVVDKTGFTE